MDARTTPAKATAGTIKIRNIAAIPDVLAELGCDVGEILARVGLEQSLFANAEQMISYSAGGRLIEECVRATGAEDFGLRIGMKQSTPILGLSGYVAANAPTVREALDTVVVSLRLSDTGGRASVGIENGFASLRWLVVEPNVPAIEQINDIAIAVGCNIMRQICGAQWRPSEVWLTRRRPKNVAPYAKFFDAPLRFDADIACLIFEESLLDRKVEGRDADLHMILSPLLEEAMERSVDSFSASVQDILRAQALAGPLSPNRAAAALGVSARTLARRLAEENVTFSELAQTVRFEAAQRLLKSDRTLAEIATALSYSDPTAFIRAFKQFTGVTPARWRRQS